MAATILGLLAGMVCLAVALGIGSGLLRRLSIHAPPYWGFALALLCGVAAIDACVLTALFAGGGVRTLRVLAACLAMAGGYELARHGSAFRVFD